MRKWILLGALFPMIAMAKIPSDFMPLGKDSKGDELFVAKSSIIYQSMAGVDVPPMLTYAVIENFADAKQIKSAVYQFFADCPIDIQKPKPPFQGSMGQAFTKANAEGKSIILMKNAKSYSIDDNMVINAHLLVCDYVATHAIPTETIGD